ncbi:MAG: prepilin-type N-terminal cleavage/methylation domain-containing protein [Verrucomicrobia bacterium]|nr:prepilin-type N-terminal cleavage/methylation domain-containing protein [Verrucomicrobiota bacterium]
MNRPRLQARRTTAGFTLLELLLATAVAAIVLLVINTTFFGALRLHNATHEKIDDDLVLQRTLGIIRRDLAGLRLPGNPQATTYQLAGQLSTEDNTTNELDNVAERITPDLYTGSAKIDGWTPFSEVQMVSYFLAAATDGRPNKDLVRVVTRNLLAATEPLAEQQRLLNNVVAAGLQFFDGENWQDSWDSATSSTLPAAIKFSVLLAARDGSAPRTTDPVELVVPIIVKTTQTAADEAAAAAASSQP